VKKIKALIVDDDETILDTVGDILTSLGHKHDEAKDIETARNLLKTNSYDYLIQDMNVPIAPDRLARRENGPRFIEEIRIEMGMKNFPIIAITGQDRGESEFIFSVEDAAEGREFFRYIQKPLDGDKRIKPLIL